MTIKWRHGDREQRKAAATKLESIVSKIDKNNDGGLTSKGLHP